MIHSQFVKAILNGSVKEMNIFMNHVAATTFSFFDTGNRMSGSQPERFYHGFVLGLLVEIIIKTGSKFTSYKKANLEPVLL